MKLWIIYSSSFDTIEDNPAKRMLKEAKAQQINAELMYYQYFSIKEDNLYYNENLIVNYPKYVFIRAHELSLIEHFESKKVVVINSYFTIKSCRDKWITHSIVDTLNVPQIKTILLNNLTFNEITSKLGTPFILKYRHGSQGNDIYLINNEDEFTSIIENINNEDYIVQEFITTSYGKDVRIYIVGDKVIGAALRQNNNGFMSNLAQGGLSYDYPLTEELIYNSLKIKDALKGDIISVDYVFGEKELLFCEANTNAGFASFNYLGYPMRELFISYIKSKMRGN